jgi:hypothetical protein
VRGVPSPMSRQFAKVTSAATMAATVTISAMICLRVGSGPSKSLLMMISFACR